VPADDGSAAAGDRGRASNARSVQAASVSQLLARMRSGKGSGVQPLSQDATGRRFPPPWTVIQHAESFAELRSQPRGILLAQRFIALIVERLDNVSVHHRPDLALFRSLGRLLCERTPDVDFLPGNPPFVNRFTNLGNRSAQGQALELGHPLLGCARARRNRHAHGGNRGKPVHSDGNCPSHGFRCCRGFAAERSISVCPPGYRGMVLLPLERLDASDAFMDVARRFGVDRATLHRPRAEAAR
jgi:hypothetical protein